MYDLYTQNNDPMTGVLMKTALMLLAITVSFNSFSAELTRATGITTAMPTALTLISMTGDSLKAAQNVIDDSQEYYQSGELSLRLSSQVAQLLEKHSDLSVDEAVDTLVSQATKILE